MHTPSSRVCSVISSWQETALSFLFRHHTLLRCAALYVCVRACVTVGRRANQVAYWTAVSCAAMYEFLCWQVQVEVMTIWSDENEVELAIPGENVKLKLKNIEEEVSTQLFWPLVLINSFIYY